MSLGFSGDAWDDPVFLSNVSPDYIEAHASELGITQEDIDRYYGRAPDAAQTVASMDEYYYDSYDYSYNYSDYGSYDMSAYVDAQPYYNDWQGPILDPGTDVYVTPPDESYLQLQQNPTDDLSDLISSGANYTVNDLIPTTVPDVSAELAANQALADSWFNDLVNKDFASTPLGQSLAEMDANAPTENVDAFAAFNLPEPGTEEHPDIVPWTSTMFDAVKGPNAGIASGTPGMSIPLGQSQSGQSKAPGAPGSSPLDDIFKAVTGVVGSIFKPSAPPQTVSSVGTVPRTAAASQDPLSGFMSASVAGISLPLLLGGGLAAYLLFGNKK
jgi:hypothetical protein